jgi:hypothetical protein
VSPLGLEPTKEACGLCVKGLHPYLSLCTSSVTACEGWRLGTCVGVVKGATHSGCC